MKKHLLHEFGYSVFPYHHMDKSFINSKNIDGHKTDPCYTPIVNDINILLQGSDRSMIDQYVETTEELLTRANKNNLSKALLYMQKALLLSGDGGRVSKDQKRLLEVDYIHFYVHIA